MVLTNALYFAADWEITFDPADTAAEYFYTQTGTATVDMMYRQGAARLAEDDAVQVLELPYKNDELSMLIVLPHEVDGLNAVESSLTPEQINGWVEDLEEWESLDIWLPKFSLDQGFSAVEMLQAMGMHDAFGSGADFSGMVDDGAGGLSISSVRHQAFITVSEEGTEAGAATSVEMTDSGGEPTVFLADHPFVFLLRDRYTGSILFMGRYANPDAE